jgi:ABC-type transporter Mla MlaB component
MLRITSEIVDGAPALKLAGNVSGPWVEELRNVVAAACAQTDRVRLDLSDVRYVDAEGGALLREIMRNQGELIRRSTFVAELLEGGIR